MNNNDKIMKKAQKFLDSHGIEYKKPGQIQLFSENKVEVIFKHPLSDNENYIVCPDEYRVVIDLNSGKAEWGFQM